jgi:hypothetical protein
MLADMDSDEITEWMAYEQVTGPLGPARHDLLHGIQTAVIANTAIAKGRKAKPTDYIPEWDRNAEPDWEQMLATAKALTSRLGGTDTTRQGGGDDDDAG